MTEELKQAAQQVLEAFDAFADADDFATLFDLIRKMNVLRDLATSQPAQEVGANCKTCNGHGLVGDPEDLAAAGVMLTGGRSDHA